MSNSNLKNIDNNKLQALNRILEAFDTDRLSKEEIDTFFEQIIVFVKKIEAKNEDTIAQIIEMVRNTREELMNINSEITHSTKEELMLKIEEGINKLQFEKESLVSEVQAKLDNVRDGIDGLDADKEEIISEVLAKIPPVKEIEKETPESIRDLLETLENNDRLDVSAIKGIEELLKKYKPQIVNVGNGAPRINFVDDETPTGLVNGINKVFYISGFPVRNSLKLYLNGQRMRETEDYTLSGKEITFIIEPPTTSVLLADYRY